MAAAESRERVRAVRSFAPPKCAEATVPHQRARTEGWAAARRPRGTT